MVVRDPDSRNPAKRSRRVPLLAAAVIAILAGPGMTAFAQADSPNLVGVSCKISGNGMTLESTAVATGSADCVIPGATAPVTGLPLTVTFDDSSPGATCAGTVTGSLGLGATGPEGDYIDRFEMTVGAAMATVIFASGASGTISLDPDTLSRRCFPGPSAAAPTAKAASFTGVIDGGPATPLVVATDAQDVIPSIGADDAALIPGEPGSAATAVDSAFCQEGFDVPNTCEMANAFGLRNNNKLSTVLFTAIQKRRRDTRSERGTPTPNGQVFLTDAVTTYSDWVCLQFARAPTPTTVGSDVTSPFCSQTKRPRKHECRIWR